MIATYFHFHVVLRHFDVHLPDLIFVQLVRHSLVQLLVFSLSQVVQEEFLLMLLSPAFSLHFLFLVQFLLAYKLLIQSIYELFLQVAFVLEDLVELLLVGMLLQFESILFDLDVPLDPLLIPELPSQNGSLRLFDLLLFLSFALSYLLLHFSLEDDLGQLSAASRVLEIQRNSQGNRELILEASTSKLELRVVPRLFIRRILLIYASKSEPITLPLLLW